MAVNMMDIVEKNGDTIHIDKLKKKLGCEVVTISALKELESQKLQTRQFPLPRATGK